MYIYLDKNHFQSLVEFPHNFAVFSSTVWAKPLPLWLVHKSNTIKMKPFNNTSIIVTANHFSIWDLFTEAVSRFVWVNRRFNWACRCLLFLCCLPLLFLLWTFILYFLQNIHTLKIFPHITKKELLVSNKKYEYGCLAWK